MTPGSQNQWASQNFGSNQKYVKSLKQKEIMSFSELSVQFSLSLGKEEAAI